MVRNQQHCSILDSIIYLFSYLSISSSSSSVNINIPNLLIFSFYMVFLKVLSLVLFFSFSTQLHLAASFLGHQSITSPPHADDTQLFLSFSPCNFSQNIQLLQNTISEISSWMASNFLSLNFSKTEFLLIGLPTKRAKIDNPFLSKPPSTSIKPVASARNLGVIFDSNLSFSDHM